MAILASVWFLGKREGKADARANRMKDELDAHDRITGAETGIGASDAERIKRLRDMGNGDW
jgi:hypothetical protein